MYKNVFNSFIEKIKAFNAKQQQMEDEHFVINRLTWIRLKDPQNIMVDPRMLSPIKFEDGKLNKEGQMVLANALAEFMREKAPPEIGSRVSFGVYLEKAMRAVEQLGLREYKKLGLLSGGLRESCFIPDNYWSSLTTVPD